MHAADIQALARELKSIEDDIGNSRKPVRV
jgi:hypothetical protein